MLENEIKLIFFEAMKKGYAFSSNKVPVLGLPGSKSIPFKMGEFSLLDYYFVLPNSNHSYCSTVIWLGDKPVWVMHYGGWYQKDVIPFLKRALMRNYENNVFLGGRGPERLESEDHTLQYINKMERNKFSDFKGCEYIISTSGQTGVEPGLKIGEHHYFGGLMYFDWKNFL